MMTQDKISHPGLWIYHNYLKPLQWPNAALATWLGFEPEICAHLLQGKLRVSHEIAWQLSRRFGQSLEFWLAWQHAYDGALSKK